MCVYLYMYTHTHTYRKLCLVLKMSNGIKCQNADYKNTTLPCGIFVK